MLERNRDELLHLDGGEAKGGGLDLDARRGELGGGETYTLVSRRSSAAPKTIIAVAPNTTSMRNSSNSNRRSAFSRAGFLALVADLELGAEELGRFDARYLGAGGWRWKGAFPSLDAGDFDRGAHEDKGFGTVYTRSYPRRRR